jgi:PAS domain S-box-containing protein
MTAFSKQNFKAILDNVADAVFVHDLKGNVLMVNQQALAMYGITEEQAQHFTIQDDYSMLENSLDQLPTLWDKAVKGEPQAFAWKARRPNDNTAFDVEVRLQRVNLENREDVVLTTVRDITVRKQAKQALQENQARLNEAQQAAHLGYWDWDIRTNDIYWSDEIYRIFGLTPQAFEPTYDAFMERVHPEDREAVQTAVNAAVSENAPYNIDHRIILPNGDVRTVNEQGNVTYNEAGEPIRMIGMVQDITERKQAERALRDSQRMLQAVLDAIPVRVFWKDKSLTYLGCNKLFAEDTGLDAPDEVVGKTDYDMPWVEQAELFRADDQHVIDSGEEKVNYEEPQTRPDGETTWLRTSKAPLRDAENNIIGVLGTYDDITEQKRAQEAHERLLQEQAELQQEVIEAQREALQELSTPVIPVMDRILVMPLIGSIDTMRARDIMRALLEGISAHRAKFVILDVTGVPVMDTGIVNHINKTIQAARLKGARTIVTGISDAVAEAIVDLGIDWGAVETLSDLQTGLVVAMDHMGIKLKAER